MFSNLFPTHTTLAEEFTHWQTYDCDSNPSWLYSSPDSLSEPGGNTTSPQGIYYDSSTAGVGQYVERTDTGKL